MLIPDSIRRAHIRRRFTKVFKHKVGFSLDGSITVTSTCLGIALFDAFNVYGADSVKRCVCQDGMWTVTI